MLHHVDSQIVLLDKRGSAFRAQVVLAQLDLEMPEVAMRFKMGSGDELFVALFTRVGPFSCMDSLKIKCPIIAPPLLSVVMLSNLHCEL